MVNVHSKLNLETNVNQTNKRLVYLNIHWAGTLLQDQIIVPTNSYWYRRTLDWLKILTGYLEHPIVIIYFVNKVTNIINAC